MAKAKENLMVKLVRAGLSLDDAATAAGVAVREQRGQRDKLIAAARAAGHSLRQIGRMFDVDVKVVHRVLTREGGESTPDPGIVARIEAGDTRLAGLAGQCPPCEKPRQAGASSTPAGGTGQPS